MINRAVYRSIGWKAYHDIRLGFNMAEVAISSLIVGVMLVASLRVLGQSFLTQRLDADRLTGHFLAHGLLGEALRQNYMEPDLTSSEIQRETGELASERTNFDDVDDYHNYIESPPKDKENSELTGFQGWQRSVVVQWVNPSDLGQTRPTETGVKRVTVETSREGVLVATAVGFLSNSPSIPNPSLPDDSTTPTGF